MTTLTVVFILFAVLTNGRLLVPQNLSNLLLQNSYILIMACGMLLCILTGGNVDLSVGSTVCVVGAAAAQQRTDDLSPCMRPPVRPGRVEYRHDRIQVTERRRICTEQYSEIL